MMTKRYVDNELGVRYIGTPNARGWTPGWYWQWTDGPRVDGDMRGPFATESQALRDAAREVGR